MPFFGPAYTLIEAARLTTDSQQVIALRMLGMLGLKGGLAEQHEENSRMVAEKTPAFLRAWSAAQQAALQGKTPDAVMRAYLGPLTSKASANRRRLAGRGPDVVN